MTTLHYVVLESNNSSQLLRILTAKLQGCVFVGDGVDAGRVDGVDTSILVCKVTHTAKRYESFKPVDIF